MTILRPELQQLRAGEWLGRHFAGRRRDRQIREPPWGRGFNAIGCEGDGDRAIRPLALSRDQRALGG